MSNYIILKDDKVKLSDVVADCKLNLCVDTKVGETLPSILRKLCAKIGDGTGGYIQQGSGIHVTGIGTKESPYIISANIPDNDTNFAKNDLIATNNRSHDWAGYNFDLLNTHTLTLHSLQPRLGATYQGAIVMDPSEGGINTTVFVAYDDGTSERSSLFTGGNSTSMATFYTDETSSKIGTGLYKVGKVGISLDDELGRYWIANLPTGNISFDVLMIDGDEKVYRAPSSIFTPEPEFLASTEVAFGSPTNNITSSSNVTYAANTLTIKDPSGNRWAYVLDVQAYARFDTIDVNGPNQSAISVSRSTTSKPAVINFSTDGYNATNPRWTVGLNNNNINGDSYHDFAIQANAYGLGNTNYMTVKTTGDIRIHKYPNTRATVGTAAKVLSTDASGNLGLYALPTVDLGNAGQNGGNFIWNTTTQQTGANINIDGSITANNLTIDASANPIYGGGAEIDPPFWGTGLSFKRKDGVDISNMSIGIDGHTTYWGISTTYRNLQLKTIAANDIEFITNGSNEVARFTSGGKVLFGSITDQGAYQLQVGGDIIAKGGLYPLSIVGQDWAGIKFTDFYNQTGIVKYEGKNFKFIIDDANPVSVTGNGLIVNGDIQMPTTVISKIVGGNGNLQSVQFTPYGEIDFGAPNWLIFNTNSTRFTVTEFQINTGSVDFIHKGGKTLLGSITDQGDYRLQIAGATYSSAEGVAFKASSSANSLTSFAEFNTNLSIVRVGGKGSVGTGDIAVNGLDVYRPGAAFTYGGLLARNDVHGVAVNGTVGVDGTDGSFDVKVDSNVLINANRTSAGVNSVAINGTTTVTNQTTSATVIRAVAGEAGAGFVMSDGAVDRFAVTNSANYVTISATNRPFYIQGRSAHIYYEVEAGWTQSWNEGQGNTVMKLEGGKLRIGSITDQGAYQLQVGGNLALNGNINTLDKPFEVYAKAQAANSFQFVVKDNFSGGEIFGVTTAKALLGLNAINLGSNGLTQTDVFFYSNSPKAAKALLPTTMDEAMVTAAHAAFGQSGNYGGQFSAGGLSMGATSNYASNGGWIQAMHFTGTHSPGTLWLNPVGGNVSVGSGLTVNGTAVINGANTEGLNIHSTGVPVLGLTTDSGTNWRIANGWNGGGNLEFQRSTGSYSTVIWMMNDGTIKANGLQSLNNLEVNGIITTNSLKTTNPAPVSAGGDNIVTTDINGQLSFRPFAEVTINGTLYVDKNSTSGTDDRTGISKYNVAKPFKTVQAAYTAATDGDIIQISGGLYDEVVTEVLGAKGNMTITFVLYNSTVTRIEANSNLMKFIFIGHGNSAVTSVRGFNGTPMVFDGLSTQRVEVHTSDSIFRNMKINTAESLWVGEFTNCDIVSTRSTGQYGVGVFDTYAMSGGATFRNCRIKHASAGFSVSTGGLFTSSGTMLLENCTIDVNGNFLASRGNPTLIVKDCYIKYNGYFFYSDNASGGITLKVINCKLVNSDTTATMIQNAHSGDPVEWANVLRNNATLGTVPDLVTYGYDTVVTNMTHF